MRERVTELKEEMKTVKEEVAAASESSSSSTSRVSSSEKVDVKLKGKGEQGVSLKVAVEE